MDAICWIPILFVAYIVVIVVKSFYEIWRDERWREKTGREKKDEFRVDILGKKTYKGWITIGDRLKIFGWWGGGNLILGILGLAKSFSEKINYGEITKVSFNEVNTAFQNVKLLNLVFERYSKKQIIRLRVVNPDDTNLIEESISKRIAEHNRKIEIERIMRARYKTGDFRDISPNNFEKVIEELFKFMGYSVMRVGGSGDGGIDLGCRNYSTGKKVIVQCKRYSGKVGIGIIRDFYGTLIDSKADKGYIVTTGEFTKEAKSWVYDKQIELVDGHRLSQLMMTYYK